MKSLRQGFSWWCYSNRGVENDALLAGAAKMGYQAVDLIDEELWQSVFDHGMHLGAIVGHASISEGLNNRAHAARIESEILQNIKKAVLWKIPALICFSGNRDGVDDQIGLEISAETLSKVASVAEKAGVSLLIELLNSKVDHKDYQCDSTKWGVRLCDRVNSPAVKLLYDVYHMQIMEGDLIRTIQECHPYFGHYHTAGNPGRGQPDGSQEINYPAIYRTIAGLDAPPLVCHEFIPKGNPLEALDLAFRQCVEATA